MLTGKSRGSLRRSKIFGQGLLILKKGPHKGSQSVLSNHDVIQWTQKFRQHTSLTCMTLLNNSCPLNIAVKSLRKVGRRHLKKLILLHYHSMHTPRISQHFTKRIQTAWTASRGMSNVTVPMPLLFPSLSSRMSALTTMPAMPKTSFSFFQPTL